MVTIRNLVGITLVYSFGSIPAFSTLVVNSVTFATVRSDLNFIVDMNRNRVAIESLS